MWQSVSNDYSSPESMFLALLVSGDEVVWIPAIPAELVLLRRGDVDVLKVAGQLGLAVPVRLLRRNCGRSLSLWVGLTNSHTRDSL